MSAATAAGAAVVVGRGDAFSVEVRGVTRSFGAVRALRGVDLKLGAGESLGLVGENGAGKSTLINVVSGALQPDAGELLIGGEPVTMRNPHAALRAGIGTVHQQNQLVRNLTAMQNVQLGNEPTQTPVRWLSRKPRPAAIAALEFVGMERFAGHYADTLTYAQRQLVSIARTLAYQTGVVIFDEPTAALSPRETSSLFEVIARLREHGTSIIYVSHRLEELPRVVERVTVMRDGVVVADRPATVSERELVSLMAGEEVIADEQRIATWHRRELAREPSGVPRLATAGLTDVEGRYEDVSLELAEGEILGLVGLPDSGVVELTQAISGARPVGGGTRAISGRTVNPRSPRQALRDGLGYLAGDRALKGVLPNLSVRENVTISALSQLGTAGIFSKRREGQMATEMARRCEVRAAGLNIPIGSLSGGNQQKALLARLLATSPPVLVCEDPTAGVDVHGRESIYELVAGWCAEGNAVVWNSTDLREVATICDRVLVLWQGRVTAELSREELDVATLMKAQFNQLTEGPEPTIGAPGA
ncbi:MAG TPA: sugar ABC transporter ATP-binding protein [Solirubrobacterales bacterium]|nr:sugar ABC transporter ATP-binding protein [Solirubrobacterales bacterium]